MHKVSSGLTAIGRAAGGQGAGGLERPAVGKVPGYDLDRVDVLQHGVLDLTLAEGIGAARDDQRTALPNPIADETPSQEAQGRGFTSLSRIAEYFDSSFQSFGKLYVVFVGMSTVAI